MKIRDKFFLLLIICMTQLQEIVLFLNKMSLYFSIISEMKFFLYFLVYIGNLFFRFDFEVKKIF